MVIFLRPFNDIHCVCPQVFYLPMALAVPPSVFAVHIQFNLLYQFWIHTEVDAAHSTTQSQVTIISPHFGPLAYFHA